MPTVSTTNTAGLNLSTIGTIGAADTKVSSVGDDGDTASVTKATTGATSLLGGLIRATAITAEARVTRVGSTTTYTRQGSSVFTDLRINGRSITATPAPNTKISIPGVATVVLNRQTAPTGSGLRTLNVIAMSVTLLSGNVLNLPTGTIVIGTASAGMNEPVHNRPYGSAYGTQVDLAGTLTSGRTATVSLPCGASTGDTVSNNVAGVNVPSVLVAGGVTSTAQSVHTPTQTTVTTRSTIAGVNLLNGLTTDDAVTGKAVSVRTDTKVTSSSEGTEVTDLKIGGDRVNVEAKENVVVPVAGVGSLTLRSTKRSSTGVQVYAMMLTLDTARAGLAAGTTIRIGSAASGVYYH